ncbi:metal-dependent hydrolase [Celerinatantimonas yamalensis]|uniref:Metal-dependent hydrolase n=1 Tax=Celerinatantimonas yamalensis TaxID=559956 RepID=A0ABW9G8T8_9GAMM
MADFKTHTIVAAGVSGAMTASLLVHFQLSVPLALLYWGAGTLGGILPDIDSDHSKAIRLIFQLLAGIVAVIAVIRFHQQLNIWQLWCAGLAGFLVIYYPVRRIFAHFTVHRGILHSLLANLLYAMLSIVVGFYCLNMPSWVAWGCGCFLFCGALIHLLLDEIYSVDLSGGRLKSSFGSALKITQWDEPLLTIAFIGAIAGLYYIAPADRYWLHLLEKIGSSVVQLV